MLVSAVSVFGFACVCVAAATHCIKVEVLLFVRGLHHFKVLGLACLYC
jgi:hypothetical protein